MTIGLNDIDLAKKVQLHNIYLSKCAHPSDINELLPIIREVASKCESCVEFGVRNPTSTYALLDGCPNVTSYDIEYHEGIETVKSLAPGFKFIQGSSLEVDIHECDMLLIDTHHKYEVLKAELFRHSDKVKKYIAMHDTATFGTCDESEYKDQPQQVYGNGPGLLKAINELLLLKHEWKIDFSTVKNNGLTILKRV